jgi:hypothetical protein
VRALTVEVLECFAVSLSCLAYVLLLYESRIAGIDFLWEWERVTSMTYDQIGRILLLVGGVVFILGLLLFLFVRGPVGKLPGDFTFTSGNFTCIAPFATMILLSLLLTIIVNVVLRVMNK